MLDYDSIKGLAKQIGRSTKDLVALAVQNDPFYAGVPGRQREAEWFAEIWHRFGFSEGVHLRRIHYVLVSQNEEGHPPHVLRAQRRRNGGERVMVLAVFDNPTPTPAALRQRRHRARRKLGRFVVPVEVTCEMVEALFKRGGLDEADDFEVDCVGEAIAAAARRGLDLI